MSGKFLFSSQIILNRHTDHFFSLVASSGINLGVTDADIKLEGLLVNLKSALQRWFHTVFPKKEVPLSLHQLVEAFNDPIDPMLEYNATKL